MLQGTPAHHTPRTRPDTRLDWMKHTDEWAGVSGIHTTLWIALYPLRHTTVLAWATRPNWGIHTLCRFPCDPLHPCSLFTGKKRKCLLVFVLP